jgi:acyl-CoA synthetase (AMP-forming)/AMP-acid ligase II
MTPLELYTTSNMIHLNLPSYNTKTLIILEKKPHILETFWGCILSNNIPIIMPPPSSFDEDNAALLKIKNVYNMLINEELIVITDEKNKNSLQKYLNTIKILSIDELKSNCKRTTSSNLVKNINSTDTALMGLTSGSTGLPKLVVHTHQTVLESIKSKKIDKKLSNLEKEKKEITQSLTTLNSEIAQSAATLNFVSD